MTTVVVVRSAEGVVLGFLMTDRRILSTARMRAFRKRHSLTGRIRYTPIGTLPSFMEARFAAAGDLGGDSS